MKIKNIDKIILGYYEIDTWYYSPYPLEFTSNKVLYICEFCLKYMRKKSTLIKHMVTNKIFNYSEKL
jgi:histone acetyltransferase MYST1